MHENIEKSPDPTLSRFSPGGARQGLDYLPIIVLYLIERNITFRTDSEVQPNCSRCIVKIVEKHGCCHVY